MSQINRSEAVKSRASAARQGGDSAASVTPRSCGVFLDTGRIYKKANVLYFGSVPCILPRNHGGLHEGPGWERWSREWSKEA